jgi:TetR/AcrR family transcriptional regulator, ethionamide resistance regulator
VSSAQQRSRHHEQRQNTRHDILAAADQFLRERPYRELSVEILMTGSGLTRTAFYRHFDDVSDLVLRLLADVGGELYVVAERWVQEAQESDDTELAFLQAAGEGLRGVVTFFHENGPLVRAIAEAATTDARIERAYNGFLDRFTELTAYGLERMIENGRIEPLDPWPVARALNLMNERYLLAEYGRGSGVDPDVAFATLATVWLRTIAPITPK